jgi:hypothetical protein
MSTDTTPDEYSTFADKRGDAYLDALLKILEAVSDPSIDRTELRQVVSGAITEARMAVEAAARGSAGSGLSGGTPR